MKFLWEHSDTIVNRSHPVRGAWIEIRNFYKCVYRWASHPVRGAWIEILWEHSDTVVNWSHPVRGAWIEIKSTTTSIPDYIVAPREGCVD